MTTPSASWPLPCPGIMQPVPDVAFRLRPEQVRAIKNHFIGERHEIFELGNRVLVVRMTGHVHWRFVMCDDGEVSDVEVLLDDGGHHKSSLDGGESQMLQHILRNEILRE